MRPVCVSEDLSCDHRFSPGKQRNRRFAAEKQLHGSTSARKTTATAAVAAGVDQVDPEFCIRNMSNQQTMTASTGRVLPGSCETTSPCTGSGQKLVCPTEHRNGQGRASPSWNSRLPEKPRAAARCSGAQRQAGSRQRRRKGAGQPPTHLRRTRWIWAPAPTPPPPSAPPPPSRPRAALEQQHLQVDDEAGHRSRTSRIRAPLPNPPPRSSREAWP